jgi:hypothetical protein
VSTDRQHSRVCPNCGRRVQTRIPQGGDGSREAFVRHTTNGRPTREIEPICDGSRKWAPLSDDRGASR